MVVAEIILSLNYSGQYDDAEAWIGKIDGIGNKYYKSSALFRAAQIFEKNGKLEDAKAKYQAVIANGNWWKDYREKRIVEIDKKLTK